MKDTDSINMYKNMRETLVYLTHLDYTDTEKIMTEKLANQVREVLAWWHSSVLARSLIGEIVEQTLSSRGLLLTGLPIVKVLF